MITEGVKGSIGKIRAEGHELLFALEFVVPLPEVGSVHFHEKVKTVAIRKPVVFFLGVGIADLRIYQPHVAPPQE